MRIAVIICSVGRPETLAILLPWLARQTLMPSDVVLVVSGMEDLPPPEALAGVEGISIVWSEKGLPRQRNRGLDAVLGRCDAVFFMDDDYLPAADAVEQLARAFADHPHASGLSGRLLADGAQGRGLEPSEAKALLRLHDGRGGDPQRPVRILRRRLVGLYGCNMAFRSSAIGTVRFDERLPLYAWQEDVDFAARVPGEMMQVDGPVGVHLGQRAGRESEGGPLGYSQIANVHYLWRKGSLPGWYALRLVVRHVLANHLGRRDGRVDRSGRARGNRRALGDILRGRAAPERMVPTV